MSVHDAKYEIYIVGYDNMNYINKMYIENILQENNFNITKILSKSDFIYYTEEVKNTADYVNAKDYSNIDCIEMTNDLDELLILRDSYEMAVL